MTTSVEPATTRLGAARAFLHALYGDGENAPGQRVLWQLDGRKSQWWPADQIDAFAQAAITQAERTDVYFGIALQDKAAAVEEKRAEERLEATKERRPPKPVTPEWVRGSANTAESTRTRLSMSAPFWGIASLSTRAR